MTMSTRPHPPSEDDTLRENMEDLISHIKEYIDTQKQIFQINAAQKMAAAVSGSITAIVMAVLGILVLLFLSISAGFYLSHLTGSNALGFLIMGGIYLVLLLIFAATKKSLVQDPISEAIIAKIMDEDHEK